MLLIQQRAMCDVELPKVDWRFDVTQNSPDLPSSTVWLVVNGHSILIKSKVIASFHVLDRKDYSAHGIPKNALSACSGWWAGAGSEYYLVFMTGRLALYCRELDETMDIPRFKLARSIAIPKIQAIETRPPLSSP